MSTTLTADAQLASRFDPAAIETKWMSHWEAEGLFQPEAETEASTDKPFTIVIPPPNVTGTLHMGHALDNTLQDVLIRYHRMRGFKTLWQPGMDHAGIATQNVVEKRLQAGELGFPKGSTRHDVQRGPFIDMVWDWANARKGDIREQFKRLGISPDWSRERFTLDEGLNKAVRKVFVQLYNEGLIYKGTRIVNWDPQTQSAISDIEVDYYDEQSFLWQIRYPLTDGSGELIVATTRPETLYGDVAVAVHPEDERYQHFIGKTVRLPLTGRDIPVIADTYVEKDFGTGALKITPAHDPNDYELGQRHRLEQVIIMEETGHIKPLDFIPPSIQGLERFEARKATEMLLEEQGFLVAKKEHTHRVGRAQRSGAVIEPLLSEQWFVKTQPLADKCLAALDGR